MLKLLLPAAILLGGCSAASKLRSAFGTKYRYTYMLSSPVRSSRLIYQDESVRFLFRIDDAAIRFRLTNKLQGPIGVQWEKASIVVGGRSQGVRNTRTLYLADAADNTRPAILPGAYVVDMAIPEENMVYDGSKWQERDLLPTTDRNSEVMGRRILGNVGGEITFFLPLQMGPEEREYRFQFEVTRVDSLPWERYRRPFRPLPPAPVEKAKPGSKQVITAAIVAGVVGVAALFLTQKKSPPSE